MLLLLCAAVIAFAVYALVRTPQDERGRGWPQPRGAAAVVLALPAVVLVLFLAPYLAALAALALTVAWWMRARPALPASSRPARRDR